MAAVTLSGDDEGVFPACQIAAYGQAAEAIVIWPYGTHGSLPVNSYVISFSINGQQENKAVIGYRPDLRPKNKKPGEFEVGNFLVGSTVFFDEQGNIIVNCEGDEIVTIKGKCTVNIVGDAKMTIGGKADIDVTGDTILTTPKLKVIGDFEVTGDTTLGEVVTSNGKDISDTHKHSDVTSGTSDTGVPI